MSDLTRQMIDGLMPPGSLWEPVQDGDFDNYLEAIADNTEIVRIELQKLESIRCPALTNYLDDLEREFGIKPDDNLTEETRRMRLESIAFTRGQKGTRFELEQQLQNSGFDVQVHSNDPAVDPSIFLDEVFQMVAGGGNAYAGRQDAFAGRIGGELLVNGDIYVQSPAYLAQAGSSYAGNALSIAGYFEEFNQDLVVFPIPTDPDSWPFIFFVGGDATRDPGTGELTEIELADIPNERKDDFKRTILRFKPLYTWAGLIVDYV